MSILDTLIGFLAPHNCIVCDDEGACLCEPCRLSSVVPLPSRCYRCSALTRDNRTCVSCSPSSALLHVWVATAYDDIPRELICRLKFERTLAAADPMARCMADALPYAKNYVVVPVPTASERARQRGYDQASILARRLSKHAALPMSSLLWRLGKTRQVGAHRNDRFTQLASAFRVRNDDRIVGARIILVDDVVTTGATLESAARCLRQAGARTVSAIVFAQKQ